MCSSGGSILPRPHDHQLRYVGGDTRIVSVSRHISFSDLSSKLSRQFGVAMAIKYQLPSEDLDALVSVTSEEDLENMMEEYDRLQMAAAGSAGNRSAPRLRLFLFPQKMIDGRSSSLSDLLDNDHQSREKWFVDALNGMPILPRMRSEASSLFSETPDYLFGFDSAVDHESWGGRPPTERSIPESDESSVTDPAVKSQPPAVSIEQNPVEKKCEDRSVEIIDDVVQILPAKGSFEHPAVQSGCLGSNPQVIDAPNPELTMQPPKSKAANLESELKIRAKVDQEEENQTTQQQSVGATATGDHVDFSGTAPWSKMSGIPTYNIKEEAPQVSNSSPVMMNLSEMVGMTAGDATKLGFYQLQDQESAAPLPTYATQMPAIQLPILSSSSPSPPLVLPKHQIPPFQQQALPRIQTTVEGLPIKPPAGMIPMHPPSLIQPQKQIIDSVQQFQRVPSPHRDHPASRFRANNPQVPKPMILLRQAPVAPAVPSSRPPLIPSQYSYYNMDQVSAFPPAGAAIYDPINATYTIVPNYLAGATTSDTASSAHGNPFTDDLRPPIAPSDASGFMRPYQDVLDGSTEQQQQAVAAENRLQGRQFVLRN